jgi:hypothetical protein
VRSPKAAHCALTDAARTRAAGSLRLLGLFLGLLSHGTAPLLQVAGKFSVGHERCGCRYVRCFDGAAQGCAAGHYIFLAFFFDFLAIWLSPTNPMFGPSGISFQPPMMNR